jgi:hypothetical protein
LIRWLLQPLLPRPNKNPAAYFHAYISILHDMLADEVLLYQKRHETVRLILAEIGSLIAISATMAMACRCRREGVMVNGGD